MQEAVTVRDKEPPPPRTSVIYALCIPAYLFLQPCRSNNFFEIEDSLQHRSSVGSLVSPLRRCHFTTTETSTEQLLRGFRKNVAVVVPPPDKTISPNNNHRPSNDFHLELDTQSVMDNAFVRSPKEVLEHFNVSEQTGLSDVNVTASRQKHGSNGMLWLSLRGSPAGQH